MSLSGNNAPTDTQTRLAHALGFTEYPKDTTAVPYLNYILKRHTGTESKEAYIELFVKIIEHFQSAAPANGTATDATVQSLVNELTQAGFGTFFAGTAAGDVRRKEIAEDTVMLMLGTWATMYSSFQHKRQRRKVVAAYRMFADQTGAHTTTPYDNSLSGLIAGSGLLPGGQWDQRVDLEGDAASKLISLLLSTSKNPNQTSSPEVSTATPGQALPSAMSSYALLDDLDLQESQSISAKRLNAFTLNVLSAVDVQWTPNVSRHLLLNKVGRRYVLELFSLPCAFDAITAPKPVGVPVQLRQEIEESYAILFNAWGKVLPHARLGAVRKVCWCWSCCAYRHRQRCIRVHHSRISATPRSRTRVAPTQFDYDPILESLMTSPSMDDWTPGSFPFLWPRITRLEQHLQSSRPWSLWVLFRDRRDTLQFWTFLFATVVVFLTVMQVLLGIAQVVGSFK